MNVTKERLTHDPGSRVNAGNRSYAKVIGRMLVVIVVLMLMGAFCFAWWYSNQIIQSKHGEPVYTEQIMHVSTTPDGVTTVSLAYTKNAARPGQYGLFWPGGSAMLGEITKQAAGQVYRHLISGTRPTDGTRAGMIWTYGSDPKLAFGYNFYEVSVKTELGVAPAWFIPADTSNNTLAATWAVTVHGSNADRHQCLQMAHVLHRAGLSILDITYRNDLGAPRSTDGLLHLGQSEWRDLEAGVRTALAGGAHHVILYGGSMGGAIVLQFLARSPLARYVSAVVLDAPMLSVPRMLHYISSEHHVPGFMTWLTVCVANWRTGIDIRRTDVMQYPPKIKPPMLIMQGTADKIMPAETAREFARRSTRSGWPVRYEEFPGAGHSESWTTDARRYENIVSEFLNQNKPQ